MRRDRLRCPSRGGVTLLRCPSRSKALWLGHLCGILCNQHQDVIDGTVSHDLRIGTAVTSSRVSARYIRHAAEVGFPVSRPRMIQKLVASPVNMRGKAGAVSSGVAGAHVSDKMMYTAELRGCVLKKEMDRESVSERERNPRLVIAGCEA